MQYLAADWTILISTLFQTSEHCSDVANARNHIFEHFHFFLSTIALTKKF